jgi:epoxyqueuosine reductase QueG
MLIHEKYGSRLHLTVVTCDIPLTVDQPVDIGVEEFCKVL